MTQSAIQIEHLSKRYRLGTSTGIGRLLRRGSILDALHNVSFDVAPGEAIGIIGRNGAGKSTLLKILSRITPPTSGKVTLRGRVASLLEVGTGFHPELSGSENIYLNGSLLGMKRREIKAKFNQIAEFSGVEGFLDTPVKRYSSGMRVRLAFAVAAHLEPEILIVDEVLAVGDAAFQQRCLGKMKDVAGSGRTVLFVSHQIAAVQNLCRRAVWLERGRVQQIGATDEVTAAYLRDTQSLGEGASYRGDGSQHVIHAFDILDRHGQPTGAIPSGGQVTFVIRYRAEGELIAPCFGIGIDSSEGQRLLFLQTKLQHGLLARLPGEGEITCTVPRLMLAPGSYALSVGCSANQRQVDQLERVVSLDVGPWDVYGTGHLPLPHQGRMLSEARWCFENEPAALRRAG